MMPGDFSKRVVTRLVFTLFPALLIGCGGAQNEILARLVKENSQLESEMIDVQLAIKKHARALEMEKQLLAKEKSRKKELSDLLQYENNLINNAKQLTDAIAKEKAEKTRAKQ